MQGGSAPPVIFVVDDDDGIREAIRGVLEDDGREVADFPTCEAFLAVYRPGREACLVIDAYLPGMNGLALLGRLHDAGHRLPAIMITGSSDVPMAVRAMKAGASDFIEKPIGRAELLACVDRALGTIAGCQQAVRLAGGCGDPRRRADAAAASGHGHGSGRPSQQEHRGRSWHQPAHGGKSSRLDHDQDGYQVTAGIGSAGACRGGERRRLRQ